MTFAIKPNYRQFLADNMNLVMMSIVLCVLILIKDWILPEMDRMLKNYIGFFAALVLVGMCFTILGKYIILTNLSYIINDETVCRKSGVIATQTSFVELYRVTDYGVSQSFLQRICKVKTISIVSTDRSDPIMSIIGVPENLDLIYIIRNKVEKCRKEKQIYEIANN